MTNKKNNNNGTLYILIIFIIMMLVIISPYVNYRINDLEKNKADRICWEEEVIEKYPNNLLEGDNNCFPTNSKIICEEGLEVEEYESLEEKCIWREYLWDDSLNKYESIKNKECIVSYFKEVCEIK